MNHYFSLEQIPPEVIFITLGGQGVDAALFVGYHARWGTLNGVLAHTYLLNVVNLWFNDKPVGEIGMNASILGHFGVPVLMISSDQAGCDEAAEFIPGIETVSVKQGRGMFSAECLPPEITHKMIKETAKKAIHNFKNGKAPLPVQTDQPVSLRLELVSALQADNASCVPGVVRIDGRTLEMTAPDIVEAHKCFITLAKLAGPNFV